jgi:hypothetical protein
MAFSGRKTPEFHVAQGLSHELYSTAIMSKTHWIYIKKYKVLVEKPERKDLGLERKVILKKKKAGERRCRLDTTQF